MQTIFEKYKKIKQVSFYDLQNIINIKAVNIIWVIECNI